MNVITREEAAKINCRCFVHSRNLKADQLSAEIRQSDATDAQKANMLHTLLKLLMFASDERDHIIRVGTSYSRYDDWLWR